MRGYRDDEQRTAEVMRDGFYHTGDVASRDADGYITYVGRADDVFKAADYRISPFELESVLIEAPGGRRGRGGSVTGRAPAGGAEGVRRACPGQRAVAGAGRRDPGLLPRAPGRVQADPADRVRRAAEDDPPGRSAGSSCERTRPTRSSGASPRRTPTTSPTSADGPQRLDLDLARLLPPP